MQYVCHDVASIVLEKTLKWKFIIFLDCKPLMFSWVHFPKHSAAEWHKWLGEVFLLCFWLIRDRKRNGI